MHYMNKRQKKIFQNEIDKAKELSESTSLTVLGSNASIGTCELCGAKNEELRPYGLNGENICYDCGMKDKESTERRIKEFLKPDH